jgi:hypothetical protein
VIRISEFAPSLPPKFATIPLCGGRVQSITVNPNNEDHIIVANQFSGLWKTENGGNTWFHLNSLSTVFAVDVLYAPDQTIIATLARDNRVDNGGGIWISTDGGNNWSKPVTGIPPAISPRIPERISAYGISYAPDDANKVYVGTDFGVATSEDNGSTWSHFMVENTSPVQPDRMQNSVWSIQALPNNKAIALSPTGVYITNDGGRSWNNIRPGNFVSLSGYSGFKNIDVSPLDSDKVFILESYHTLLLYEVADNKWSKEIPLRPQATIMRGPFVRVSKSEDTDSISIWIGQGINLLKATCKDIDAVKKLTASDWAFLWRTEGIHDDTGYLGLDKSKMPVLYGSDGGLFKPTNPEATKWTLAAPGGSGMNSYQITDVAGTNVGSFLSSLYFATQDNGIWASDDGGYGWPYEDCAEGFYIQVMQDAASDSEVKVAYARIGCDPGPSMFSKSNLKEKETVPDIDTAGGSLSSNSMAQAFFISKNKWIRYGKYNQTIPEIYISENNGKNWRKKANVHLRKGGLVVAAVGPSSDPIIYAPFVGSTRRADGRERIGLIQLTDVFSSSVDTYSNSNLIYLPDEGGLGMRAMEFPWDAVYGVDPKDSNFIIAPDIHNEVVRVSRNGGGSWTRDINLTKEVTKGGTLLLYDQDEYHMQVTCIKFDPYDPNRILVGTRDAGVIFSKDRGATWETIPGSEIITYITNFFFTRDDIAIASSYGRGLWMIDFHAIPFPEDHCIRSDCTFRSPFDPALIFPPPFEWLDKDVLIFLNGRINGLILEAVEVKKITVTPGSISKRYLGETKNYNKLNVIEDQQGVGFNGLNGCLDSLQRGEIIKGIFLKENEIIGIITGKEEFTSFTNTPDPNEPQPSERHPESDEPYLFIGTNLPVSGTEVLGSDGIIHIFATGFRFDPNERNNNAIVTIDEKIVNQTAKIMQDGTVKAEVKVSEGLSNGKHVIKLIQQTDNERIFASATFIKANIDDEDVQ